MNSYGTMLRRPAAVAGSFYPAEGDRLAALVDRLLREARPYDGPPPKAIIVPHAGYVYSGPVAASAYRAVASLPVSRVVLLGPAHRVSVRGLASPGVELLEGPLGDLPVDTQALAAIPAVLPFPVAHAREHSLEVQFPFVQRLFPHARVAPLLVGRATPTEVLAVLDALWGGPETLLVVSTDLSHYLTYEDACRVDENTVQCIEALDFERIADDRACGLAPLAGLLLAARLRELCASRLDVRNSGDTAGTRKEVVGYAAVALHERAAAS